jgi:sugar O-acyltransferase (sialic acid O-acetyltransferase NeuD family)
MKYLILGCGGHAKVLIGTISMMKDASVHGLLTSNSNELGLSILGCDVLGMDEDINKFSASEFSLVNGVGDLKIRQHLFEKYQGKNYIFPRVIHPFSYVSPSAILLDGCQVMAGAVVQPDVVLGLNCIINTNASVDHDCQIGSHVHIAPGATVCGEVRIADGVHVGAGATLIQGVAIGKGSVIGAGAVVTKDVAENQMVVGVPAKGVKHA